MNPYQILEHGIKERVFIRSSPTHRITYENGGNPTESSWIFDFRAVMLDAIWLNAYAEIFWEKNASKLPFQVGGMETAAIPLISAIVMKSVARGTPVNGFYIRKSRKREGLMKQIEGTLTDEPVVLVDDLIHTGGSFEKQIILLEEIGKKVLRLFTVLAFKDPSTYEFATKRTITIQTLFPLSKFQASVPTPGQRSWPGKQDDFDVVWKFKAPEPGLEHVVQKSSPALDAQRIYFGTDNGIFFALDKRNGNIVWQFNIEKHPSHKGIFSSPAIHANTVFFGAYDGNVYALDATTGKQLWKNSEADWVGSSPSLDPKNSVLYIGLEYGLFKRRGGVAAFDMRSGKIIWKDRTSALTHGSPLYIEAESMIVVGSNDGLVYAYDAKNGTLQWKFQTRNDIKMRPAYDSKLRVILVASMDANVYALSPGGTLRWKFETGGPIYSTPLVQGETTYVSSLDKTMYALGTQNGAKKWEFETLGRIFSSPVFAGGSIWIGSNDGILYELDPETGRRRASHQFSERIVNPVAYDSQTREIFVSTVANEIYKLHRKPRTDR